MKKTLTLLTIAAMSLCGISLSAQQNSFVDPGHLPCGTDQQMEKVFAQHPELKAGWEQENSRLEQLDAVASKSHYSNSGARLNSASTATTSPPTYIIPIVFHIIHMYGSENISDAQVIDEVRILNEDYRKLNADTSSIVSQFISISADASIEFRLANLDPNGNCTNGIDRVVSAETYIGDDGSKLNYWPRSKYLNVWVVAQMQNGVAGYAYLPGTAPSASVDGVIILSQYIGSIGTGNYTTSRALTHEIGHFLNLQHVWGSSNNPGVACGNDGVSDTPVTKGWTSCNLTSNAVCNASIVENVQNYMEYSYCSRMFTNGQSTRMHNALNSSTGQRSTLVSAASATAAGINNNPPVVCSPQADFSPVNDVYVCVGGTVSFTDLSWSSAATSWSWNFQGGTPSTSTSQNPTITYNTAGTYSVSLTATNSAGSSTKSRTSLVHVLSATPQYSNIYSESFENSTNVSNDWIIDNPTGNNQWTRVTTTSYTGSASMKLNNTTNSTGEIDAMIGPSIDMTTMNGNNSMTFRVAFAQKATTNTDKLRVLVSTNCGATWTQRFTKANSNLATVATQTTAFTPSQASDWRLETVNLAPFGSTTNLRIKFEFTSGGGNNIYIEDININNTVGVTEIDQAVQNLNIYPNPAQSNTTIDFTLVDKQDVKLELIDLLGRTVSTLNNGELNSGEHRFDISTEGTLTRGIYFVRLSLGNRTMTRKLVVE